MNASHLVEPRTDADAAATGPAPPAVDPPRTPSQRGVAELVVGFVIALAAMFVFAFVADRVYAQEAFALDAIANPFLHSISSPTLDLVMTAITDLGSAPGLGLLFAISMAVLLARRRRAMALFLAVAGPRRGAIAVAAAVVVTMAIGFSRVYLGYHYVSDVVGGFAAGLAWLFVVALAFETVPPAWARRPWARARTTTGT
jgi:undecaprenyl-diphosphatase